MVSAPFFTPLFIGGLGVERYGLLLLTMTTVGMMAMHDLDLGAASIREMSPARVKEVTCLRGGGASRPSPCSSSASPQ